MALTSLPWRLFWPLVAAALLPFALHGAEKKAPRPKWMSEVTRTPAGNHANMRAVKLNYTLGWNNTVNAGKFEITIGSAPNDQSRLQGTASGGSSGLAKTLWPYQFEAQSAIDRKTLRPLGFELTDVEKRERSRYKIDFLQDKQVFTTVSEPRKGESKTKTSGFDFSHGHDALSGALYLRSHPLNKGDEITVVVTPFNKPYIAKFKVGDEEKRTIRGTTYNAIRLSANVAKINPDLSMKTYEKVKTTTLWLSADEYRIPLELQTEISVGYVSARLDRLKWLE